MEVTIIHYFSLISSPLFLLGAIKLRQVKATRGRTLLVAGFLLLTVVATSDAAQFFEVFNTDYRPWMDDSQFSSFHNRVTPWERWFYWIRQLMRWLGFTLSAIGFITEGRNTLSTLRKEEQQRILTP